MSDPVSSRDVEDVLSSIRRLVSEETKSAETRGQAAQGQTTQGQVTQRPPANSHETADSVEASVAGMFASIDSDDDDDEAGSGYAGSGTPPSNEIAGSRPDESRIDDIVRQFSRPDTTAEAGEDTAPAKDQRLVLTAALRVAEANAAETDDMIETDESSADELGSDAVEMADVRSDDSVEIGADDSEDEIADETPITFTRPTRPARPDRLHLRPVRNEPETPDQAEDTDSPAPERPSLRRADVPPRARSFEATPDELLFDRARREMEAATGPTRPSATAENDQTGPRWGTPESNSDEDVDSPISRLRRVLPDVDEAKPMAADDLDEIDEVSEAEAEDTAPVLGAGRVFSRPMAPKFTPDEDHGPIGAGGQTAQTSETPEEDEPQSTINFAEADESILDEDTLRDLVSQMVREELQGELGDRITRNVRKLVRREIQRALASREFE
jgi:hypothetical protein